jgi:hypothetical protein
MSNVELWTYISYGIAGLFFLVACAFGGLIFLSSQNSKKNPIALPKKQVVEEKAKEFFDDNDDSKEDLKGSLPSRRRRTAPVMHEPKGNLRASKNFFDDDDDSFKITGGQSK